MSHSKWPVRGRAVFVEGVVALFLGWAVPVPRAQGQSAPPARTPAGDKAAEKPATKADTPQPGSVKENIKNLGREVTDPKTLQRIKGHEQDLEKKVERTRDRQRQDHGKAKPHDAVDLAKSLDAPEAAGAVPARTDAHPAAYDKTKTKTTAATKDKGRPAPAVVPADVSPATKSAPAR